MFSPTNVSNFFVIHDIILSITYYICNTFLDLQKTIKIPPSCFQNRRIRQQLFLRLANLIQSTVHIQEFHLRERDVTHTEYSSQTKHRETENHNSHVAISQCGFGFARPIFTTSPSNIPKLSCNTSNAILISSLESFLAIVVCGSHWNGI